MTKNNLEINIKISHDNEHVKEIKNTTFLGFDIDNSSS